MESELLHFVRSSLQGAQLSKVAAATGNSVRWLRYLRDGYDHDPKLMKIERLAKYLRESAQ